METNEEKFEAGIAVLEMARTAGWKWLEGKIREELAIEYVEKIISMVENAVREKDEAANAMNRE